jgi:hypothetical protein
VHDLEKQIRRRIVPVERVILAGCDEQAIEKLAGADDVHEQLVKLRLAVLRLGFCHGLFTIVAPCAAATPGGFFLESLEGLPARAHA